MSLFYMCHSSESVADTDERFSRLCESRDDLFSRTYGAGFKLSYACAPGPLAEEIETAFGLHVRASAYISIDKTKTDLLYEAAAEIYNEFQGKIAVLFNGDALSATFAFYYAGATSDATNLINSVSADNDLFVRVSSIAPQMGNATNLQILQEAYDIEIKSCFFTAINALDPTAPAYVLPLIEKLYAHRQHDMLIMGMGEPVLSKQFNKIPEWQDR